MNGFSRKGQAAMEGGIRGKGQRILVVDDQEAVRELYRMALESFNYQVNLTADGAEALEAHGRALEGGQPFDLAVLDLAMPKMDGAACARAMLERDPQARIIIATGHDSGCHLVTDLPSQVKGVLHKPFSLKTLIDEVSRALAA
jgi:CheY-like chemotaxis protein